MEKGFIDDVASLPAYHPHSESQNTFFLWDEPSDIPAISTTNPGGLSIILSGFLNYGKNYDGQIKYGNRIFKVLGGDEQSEPYDRDEYSQLYNFGNKTTSANAISNWIPGNNKQYNLWGILPIVMS